MKMSKQDGEVPVPNSEDNNPFTSISPEIISSLNSCNQLYLRSVILQVLCQHPELTDVIQDLLSKACANQENDKVNKLLSDAHLPGYPEHHRLTDFNPACLSDADQSKYKELASLSFLNSESRPNVLLYGLADQGRDKIAIGLGDACCRAKRSVFFVSYSRFAEIMRTHGVSPSSNTAYNVMMKANCLIIDDFAGTRIYDEELLDGITQFIEARVKAHKESYIQHKHNSKKPFVPCCTIATSSFEPVDWVKYMDQNEKKTYALARFFYQSYATIIHVDETNIPSSDNKQPNS